MRMSDEQYFRSCVAQERHLAHLLGCHEIEEDYESAGVLFNHGRPLPQWTRDWSACGPLIARHRLTVEFQDSDEAHPGGCIRVNGTSVRVDDHPSADHALRFAVVKAVIHLLEHAGKRHAGAA